MRELLDAVLTSPWQHLEGGLASYRCVKENASDGSRLVVDVVIESANSEEDRPLRPGKSIGPYQQYRPARKEEVVMFVFVIFTKISSAEVRFSAGLMGRQYDKHGKEMEGTIGIGCGAGDDGILVKTDGHWRKAVQQGVAPDGQAPAAPARR